MQGLEAQVSRLTKAIEKPSPEKGSSGPVAAEARGPEVVVLPSAELAHLAALEILAGLKTRDEAILFGFTFDREDLADGLNKARLRGCKVMLVVDRRQAASGAREQLRVPTCGPGHTNRTRLPVRPSLRGGRQKFAYRQAPCTQKCC